MATDGIGVALSADDESMLPADAMSRGDCPVAKPRSLHALANDSVHHNRAHLCVWPSMAGGCRSGKKLGEREGAMATWWYQIVLSVGCMQDRVNAGVR